MEKYVQWWLTGHGYAVAVFDGNSQPIAGYSAGNHPLDSQAVAPAGHAVPDAMLEKWARQTAEEMATVNSVLFSRISRDVDTENDLRGQLDPMDTDTTDTSTLYRQDRAGY